MAKRFTPVIGLAVVVALAMVAVFGAMSLTNPAFAAIGQPADAELTERTFSPQVPQEISVDVYLGEEETVDLIPYLDGREDEVEEVSVSTLDPVTVVTIVAIESRRDVGVTIEEVADDQVGNPATALVTVTFSDDTTMAFFITATVRAATAAMVSSEVQATVTVPVGDEDEDGAAVLSVPVFLKVDHLFERGRGEDGEITRYTASTSTTGSVITVGELSVLEEAHQELGGTLTILDESDIGTEVIGAIAHIDTDDGRVDAQDADIPPNGINGEVKAALGATVVNKFKFGEPTGYIVLYATGDAAENNFSTIMLSAVDSVEGDDGADPSRNVLARVGPVAPVSTVSPIIDVETEDLPLFEPGSSSPGSDTSYKVTFEAEGAVNTRQSDLEIEFDGDYGMPSTIRNTSVAITTEGGEYPDPNTNGESGDTSVTSRTFTPEDVTVDGETVLISLGDMDEHDDRIDYDLSEGEVISVLFRQSAGISNPTEAKGYNLVKISFGGAADIEYNDGTKDVLPNLETSIIRKVSLSEGDGGLDTAVTGTGKGFKDKTSLTVFLDKPIMVYYDADEDDSTDMVRLPVGMGEAYNDMVKAALMVKDGKYTDVGNVPLVYLDDTDMPLTYQTVRENNVNVNYITAPNGMLDQGEDELCVVTAITGQDIGACEFKVTHPTFRGGFNYVNAKDGRSNYAPKADTFELTASIATSPGTGSPGERILVQVVDFPPNSSISRAELARNSDDPVCTGCGSVDGTGAGTFSFTIPNWPSAGTQELRVFGINDVKASKNFTVVGPQISVTPQTVVANQRVSLIGTGFSPGAVIANAEDDQEEVDPIVTIGGRTILSDRINDGDPVRVDNGGNWSASVDLPLTEATTAPGQRAIRITDSRARTGSVEVTIPARNVTVSPEQGRVGTIAVVRGQNFPSKNDEGDPVTISIVYDASNNNTTTVSASVDASGRFETQIRIPTTAAIPSSNSIKVSFPDRDGVVVPVTVPHEVPEGIVELSVTSGGPGSRVTVNGEGFKSFVPISLVKVGTLDVTPAPKPSTDGNGMMSFDITIPGLDVGIQTIEVSVGRTTASTGFTVTESGVSAGDIKLSAEAVEDMGDNFVRAFNFNNDTKTWTFYDPAAGDASTLTHFITGESYWILIQATQEVILNGKTRNLTCVDGNCWNLLVW